MNYTERTTSKPSLGAMESPSSWTKPNCSLAARISSIVTTTFNDHLPVDAIADLKEGFKVAHSWSWSSGEIRALLSKVPKETLQAFLLKQMENDCEEEILTHLQQCLTILENKALLKLSDFNDGHDAAIAFKIHAATKMTALRNGLEKEGHAIAKEFIVELKYFFHKFMEILITLVGLNEISRQKHTKYTEKKEHLNSEDAQIKLETYWKLIALPATLFGIIYSRVNYRAPAAFLTLTSTLSSIIALVAYNRYWKPCPIDHNGLKNLSIELLRETIPSYPRRDILTQIEEAFQARKGVILVGEPGAGKSWIVRSFVEETLAGRICKFVKNPQIFSCNGATLGNQDLLFSIEDRFRRFKDQVVFFFDEFHSLFRNHGLQRSTSSEEIKTFQDEFKFVIGATTTDEYQKFIADKMTIIGRRFTIIHVDAMKNEEIETALSHYLAHAASKISFEPAVIKSIITNAPKFNSETSLIDAAHSLLQCAIQKMIQFEDKTLTKKIIDLKDKIESHEQYLIMRGQQHGKSGDDRVEFEKGLNGLTALKTSLEKTEQRLEQRNHRISRMQKIESKLLKLRQQSYHLAEPNRELVEKSPLERKWIILQTRISLLEKFIAEERDGLGLPRCLDISLIETIVNERIKIKKTSAVTQIKQYSSTPEGKNSTASNYTALSSK